MGTLMVKIYDETLRKAADEGIDAFVAVFVQAVRQAIGGTLNADNMTLLNTDQITLLAWDVLHEEVMDGGFIQLIHNGYGPFIFRNPFAKMMREWDIPDMARLINKAHKLYAKFHQDIENDCSDEQFMALFEQFPQFDDCDDYFVEHEEEWTEAVAVYIDNHIERFAEIVQ